MQKSIHTAKSRIRSGPPRIAPPGSTSVDRRPTTICVTGFELDESDIILGHFKVSSNVCLSVLTPDSKIFILISYPPHVALWRNNKKRVRQICAIPYHILCNTIECRASNATRTYFQGEANANDLGDR